MTPEYFTAAMKDAHDYPLPVRIAALWIADGKTAAEFHKAYCGPGHRHGLAIGSPMIVAVHNAINDLAREGIDDRLCRLTC